MTNQEPNQAAGKDPMEGYAPLEHKPFDRMSEEELDKFNIEAYRKTYQVAEPDFGVQEEAYHMHAFNQEQKIRVAEHVEGAHRRLHPYRKLDDKVLDEEIFLKTQEVTGATREQMLEFRADFRRQMLARTWKLQRMEKLLDELEEQAALNALKALLGGAGLSEIKPPFHSEEECNKCQARNECPTFKEYQEAKAAGRPYPPVSVDPKSTFRQPTA